MTSNWHAINWLNWKRRWHLFNRSSSRFNRKKSIHWSDICLISNPMTTICKTTKRTIFRRRRWLTWTTTIYRDLSVSGYTKKSKGKRHVRDVLDESSADFFFSLSFTRTTIILTTTETYLRVKSVNQSSLVSKCCALNLTVLLLVVMHRISLVDWWTAWTSKVLCSVSVQWYSISLHVMIDTKLPIYLLYFLFVSGVWCLWTEFR